MASIARSLRAAAPVARALAPRAAPLARAAFRPFSTSKLSLARRYTKEHEWIDLSADNKTGVMGISSYAAEQLGDVVYVELPEAGDWVEKGDAVGAVESVKSASDINAPIRLRVTHSNASLEEKPSTINNVPEDDSAGGGWIAKVEVDEVGAKEFEGLMDADAYKAYSEGEDH
ncbi:glycine cleavage H-protein-domain-containing protein [Ilyonectria robusta]|uniref:glycine cleavage H-protein-domain-containing protein n=1 Tax=Ilyonectria robusta TaxID=1079257 RepID=UPI001E8ED554|nr:glycine cleavage H-protein-domain-containing protein [Ilyonectria robusta]KAH7008794.1 glycine cleavage H-protein-domain-containing protein [Ilyonectria destructans]KAH8734024.1 glycine cleavage H-protein-domain-containing protein [Ilyonectria robusta]